MTEKRKTKSAAKPKKSRAKTKAAATTPRKSARPRKLSSPKSPESTVSVDARPGPPLTDMDVYLFNEGSHLRLYDKLGAHPEPDGSCWFAVWAPNAEAVSVIGDFNGWNRASHPLTPAFDSGIWQGRIENIAPGSIYKYHIVARGGDYVVDKADPFGFRHECPPATGSVVTDLAYTWADRDWMATRGDRQKVGDPISIYEVHLGSWRRSPETGDGLLGYRDFAQPLADYCADMGFTHVELLPIMEHPFYGSWGYQTTGYFAPTSRYGAPEDLMFLIDTMHQHGIGVILDWVPSHFPTDQHGLGYFDGTHLFEHADPRQGFHPDWGSAIFNYGRNEVRSFLMSNAFFWLEKFHADGIRVDAVASMLYLDYSRKHGEWIPNEHGGRENLEAISFLRRLNEEVYRHFPSVQTFAEESTAWPMVSRPTYVGGLGFGFKWDMGWMHDTLVYMGHDPIHRKYHHSQLSFRQIYAYTENFVLPLSHDEVVHGKGSLIGRMPGDDWQRFANLRLLYAYQWAQNGKKLLFMGGEFAQWAEWNHDASLDWHLAEFDRHEGIQRLVRDLNRLYRTEPAMHAFDCDGRGFEWIDANDGATSALSFLRRGPRPEDCIAVALNFTPIPRHNYRIGVPFAGDWTEVLNSDTKEYGGSGHGNLGGREAAPVVSHGRPYSLCLTLPPLGAVFLKHEVSGA